MKEYTIDELAQMIDHTNLHTDASKKDMEKLCNEAKDYHSRWLQSTRFSLIYVQNY